MSGQSPSILFVADVFHPIHHLAVQSFLNGNVSHGHSRGGPVPVLFSRREPNHVSGVDFFCRAAFPLDPSTTCRDNQRLSERMCMPGGARSRLKCDAGASNKAGVGCLKKRVDTYDTGKPVCRTFT